MRLFSVSISNQSGVAKLTALLLFIALASGTQLAKDNLRETVKQSASDSSQPPLYLPSADHVRLVTLGYDSFASHIIWFSTQSYFGKQLRGEQDYRWLEEMCLLMAELDPSAHHAFEFCASMLSWTAQDSTASNRVISKVIELHPDNWYYRYLRGFNYFYFLGERKLAKNDLSEASKLEGAPIELLSGLVSRLMVSEGDPVAAIAFLKQMVATTHNKTIRKILSKRLKQAYLARNLRYLDQAALRYKEELGRYPESVQDLLSSGIIQGFPPDPFGGQYIIDSTSGEFSSTIGDRGLVFKPHNPDHNPLAPSTEAK